jgi:dihydropyrimidinase
MIFHVSTAEGAAVIRKARGEGLKVFAETCPQYLFMTRRDLDKPGLEGGKWMFSPPAREVSDQEALWQALDLGDLQAISSDHAPYAFDKTGKLVAGKKSTFKQIPNGMPGLEARLPVVFDEMVSNGRFDVSRFVQWTSTEPAKIYGLYPKKGTLAIGSDADIAIWDPKKSVTFSDRMVKDRTGYTPWKGRTVKGWPTTVLLRGEVLVENNKLRARPGSGQFLARKAGKAAEPLGRATLEFDPKRNFGARLR